MNNTHPPLRLTLFFSWGIALRTWDAQGMFDREVALYQQLQARGVQVRFVTYGDASDLHYAAHLPGIAILCNRWRLRRKLYALLLPWLHAPWLQASDVIKTNQADGANVALHTARCWRTPLIARCGYMWSANLARLHGATSPVARHARTVEQQVFAAAQRVVVTTAQMAADIAQRVPAAAARTLVIPNYVDTDIFRPQPAPTPDIDLIFIGRIAVEKNLAALLEAIRPLNLRLIVIGSGPLQAALQQQFADLHDRVYWQGNVPNRDLPGYLHRARVFILPSHYEGHPKTLLEAMACGLPVIGTNVPGIAELLHHKETGYLCVPSPAGIRAAIQNVLADEQLRAHMAHNAHQFVLQHFALERIVELELAVLQEVAG